MGWCKEHSYNYFGERCPECYTREFARALSKALNPHVRQQQDIREVTMKAPTEQQLKDPAWWDENAPPDANFFLRPRSNNVNNSAFFAWSSESTTGVKCGGESYHVITKYWHDPVPRPTKPAAPEWDEGMPKAGVRCEVWVYESSSWESCLTLDATTGSGEIACTTIAPDGHFRQLLWGVKFRPIRTQAERERDELNQIIDAAISDHPAPRIEASDIAEAVIAAGWRKGE